MPSRAGTRTRCVKKMRKKRRGEACEVERRELTEQITALHLGHRARHGNFGCSKLSTLEQSCKERTHRHNLWTDSSSVPLRAETSCAHEGRVEQLVKWQR